MPACAPIPNKCSSPVEQRTFGSRANLLARLATQALIEEADLTPKPGLVDRRGSGAHADMTLDTMHRSAQSLFRTFKLIAQISERRNPTRQLSEQLGAAGRNGEREMLLATGGCNTHRGAIWTLGLLVAAAAIRHSNVNASMIGGCAAQLARFRDRLAPASSTSGSVVARIYVDKLIKEFGGFLIPVAGWSRARAKVARFLVDFRRLANYDCCDHAPGTRNRFCHRFRLRWCICV
jgi:hypothetical protein